MKRVFQPRVFICHCFAPREVSILTPMKRVFQHTLHPADTRGSPSRRFNPHPHEEGVSTLLGYSNHILFPSFNPHPHEEGVSTP